MIHRRQTVVGGNSPLLNMVSRGEVSLPKVRDRRNKGDFLGRAAMGALVVKGESGFPIKVGFFFFFFL